MKVAGSERMQAEAAHLVPMFGLAASLAMRSFLSPAAMLSREPSQRGEGLEHSP